MLEEFKNTKQELNKTITTLILGGLGFVAALAWNEAIQELFNLFLPKESGLIGKFLYAIIITVVVVIVSMRLRKNGRLVSRKIYPKSIHTSPDKRK